MKIALLTARWQAPGVLALVEELGAQGIEVGGIVCARHPRDNALRHWLANNLFARRLALRVPGESKLESQQAILPELRRRGIECHFFLESFNSPGVVEHLQRVEPDLLVNYRGPIYRRPLIEAARIGLINWHMALLPEFRGMNVAEWSVLHGYPTGATVHFIDPGIDTGDILAFFPVPVRDCRTSEEMRDKLFALQYQHIAKAVRLLADGEIEPVTQSREAGKQYFTMHPKLRARVETLLAGGYEPTVTIPARQYVQVD